MQITGVHHLALALRDLDESEVFYTKVLGGTVIHRHGSRGFEREADRIGNTQATYDPDDGDFENGK